MDTISEILKKCDDGIMNHPEKRNYNKGKLLQIIGELSESDFEDFCNQLSKQSDLQ
jgi:hypothetical protein